MIEDGGPAFPVGNAQYGYVRGMSLRQWYAGMALQGLLANISAVPEERVNGHTLEVLAFKWADAMLKAES